MTDHLSIVSVSGSDINFCQREFADAWVFLSSGDCVNFGQIDPSITNADGESGDVEYWAHACDLDLLIEMLVEVRDKIKAHRAKETKP